MKTQDTACNIVATIYEELSKVVIGQRSLIQGILTAFIAGGHVLIEGMPGLAKTLVVKSFASIMGLSFKRLQFTPDLLPADLLGTLVFEQQSGSFSMRKGPIFANLVLADEINRAPPKVQSALLEAMEEKQVTLGGISYSLPQPFFVLATQNPIEQEGTYSLPEAELDRFLLKLTVPYPSIQEEIKIVYAAVKKNKTDLKPIFTMEDITNLKEAAQEIRCDEKLVEYIVSIVAATRAVQKTGVASGSYLSYILAGASPRASIALYQCAKIHALLNQRSFVLPEDIKHIAHSVLRHRLILSYEAIAENLDADAVIDTLLSAVPQP